MAGAIRNHDHERCRVVSGPHAALGCEDCRGLLDGILSDFDDYDGSPARPRSPPAPYRVVFGHDDDTLLELEWAEEAAMDPFATSESAGGWYMDGLVMAMAWDEQQDGGGFPFEPCYGYEGEAGAAGQLYDASPLWEFALLPAGCVRMVYALESKTEVVENVLHIRRRTAKNRAYREPARITVTLLALEHAENSLTPVTGNCAVCPHRANHCTSSS
ncbi:hypothetical protein Zm00014a_026443 [Zea mays]|uniref:Uncharacterized protein n=1 Tax=Zea mays TaxID=4577 RepID=A0A3L6FGF5_MAIZE|nr:hypothetical protein Zm00014a_026443 [Zea mays]